MNNRNFLATIWDAELSDPMVKFVLVAIAQNATRDGIVRMSIDRLTRATGLDALSIYDAILWLQKEGWVTVQIGTDDQVTEKSKKSEYLASIVGAIKAGDKTNIPDTIPNEPWFFCVNRSIRQTRMALA